MSEYKNIIGKGVRFLSSNLDNDQAEGQIWYNSTDGAFKNLLVNEAWSSGGNLITARSDLEGTGTQTAALGFGGYVGPGTPNISNATEEYNGSGWASGGAMGTGRRSLGGAGTQTAGLAVGGTTTIPGASGTTDATEEYDGSSWTAGGALNTGRIGVGGLGTQTAAVAFGGASNPPFADRNITEEYNGTSWTAVPATLTSARRYIKGCGVETAGLGTSPTGVDEYDGSAWTAGGSFNTGRPNVGSFAGTQTSALMGGGGSGGTPVSGATESYDGSTWTTSPATMATARYAIGGAGADNTSSLGFGGTGYTSSTEEYNKSTTVFTPAAWSAGGNLSTGRYELGTVGTQDAGLAFGGNNVFTGLQSSTEEYDGSAWSSGGALPAAKATQGFGVQTAAVTVGGTVAPNPTAGSTTEEYNGSSWTSSGALNTATVASAASTGLESAGLRAGGGSNPTTRLSAVEEYNGSSWTSVTSLPSTRFQFQGTGPQTAAFFTGGNTAPPSEETTDSFDYDGTNWTSGPTMVFGVRLHAVSGNSNTDNLSFGGEQAPGGRSLAQSFNGTNFLTAPSLATGRNSLGGCGTASASLAAGGNNAPSYNLVNTEEFTGETSALNIKTISTS